MREYVIGDEVLSGWRITRNIGQGAFGKVYEVEKAGHGVTARSALKVVDVPPSESMVKSALAEGMDETSISKSFREVAENLASEVSVLQSMPHPHIVTYQDHEISRDPNGPGWRILLRMELLQPLVEKMRKDRITQVEVARLGSELAEALAFCHARGIIHRDVKPENIFIDAFGRFKLGDFGVSRAMEGTQGALSRKGTESYMAPELYRGEDYGASVDVYALGLVMYQLLNGNRLPFLPPAPQPISFHDRQSAASRRLAGEALPRPDGTDYSLFVAISRMCALTPASRPSAAEAASELAALIPRLEAEQTLDASQNRVQPATGFGTTGRVIGTAAPIANDSTVNQTAYTARTTANRTQTRTTDLWRDFPPEPTIKTPVATPYQDEATLTYTTHTQPFAGSARKAPWTDAANFEPSRNSSSGMAGTAPNAKKASPGDSSKTLAIVVAAVGVAIVIALAALIAALTDDSDSPGTSQPATASTYTSATTEPSTESVESVEVEAPEQVTETTTEPAEPSSTAATEPEPTQAAANYYILPDSDTRVYSRSELDQLSDYELCLARNEIPARHGMIFKREDLANYFASQSWYTGRLTIEEFQSIPNILSGVEEANVDTILALEKDRGSIYVPSPS